MPPKLKKAGRDTSVLGSLDRRLKRPVKAASHGTSKRERPVWPGLWGTLDAKSGQKQVQAKKRAGKSRAAKKARRPRAPADIWKLLGKRIDPTQYRPKLAADIEIKHFPLRWGNDYVMAANPRDLLHYRLEPGEVELMELMDGTRTVRDIVLERFHESGDLELSGVVDLVMSLQAGSFLDPPYVDTDAALEKALDPISPARRKAREFLKTLMIEWSDADKLVRWMYNHILKWFFKVIPLALSLVVAITGFVAFYIVVHGHRFSLTSESAATGGLIILGLNYFLTFVHELGHATVMIHYGRRVKSAGFMIYFGSPAFFVESSDGLMMERKQRMAQSFAGPYAEAVIAGGASLIVLAFPGLFISSILYKFAVINYFLIFLNLVPLLELDGYWILSDLIQVPDLRPRSLQFFRHDFMHKLRKRERLTLQEVGLLLYAVLGVFFTIFTLYSSVFFWEQIFGSLIARLWHGGLITRGILVAIALFVGGPLIRGALKIIGWLVNHARVAWRQLRFKLETKWRVEAAELIDAVPLFDDVPVEVLNELAGRVKLRAFRSGQSVVRQGERAEAFYIVRSGVLHAIEESEGGKERVLRILGRGESFGELAVAQASRRRATVRAIDDCEVFEIDKGSFDRLLADMIKVPAFAPTFQDLAELRDLGCFSHLEQDELVDLLKEGDWFNVGPGELIVKQGEAAETFYAIHSGQVEVIEGKKVVGSLGPGAYFGEIGLLLHVRRTATVRALTAVRLYRLNRKAFDRLMRSAFKKGTLNPHAAVDRVAHH
ncbi:MAG: cyclic nucleotide-binding domain-containing protein [Actinomycetota bacterium]|nr:cyclic nucleotide-binding domain-containing protein [Actinomycetota bacterium]